MTARKIRTFDGVAFATPLTVDGKRASFVSGAETLGYVVYDDGGPQPVEVWLDGLTDVREVSR